MNQPSKRTKNRRNENFWKIRMQGQISDWRKELSIIGETGTGSNNGELNRKKRKILQKYRVTNAKEVAQLKEILQQKVQALQQKVQAKAQRHTRYEKMETCYIQHKMFKDDTKTFYRNLGTKNIQATEPPSMAEVQPYWKSLWGDKALNNERAEWIRGEERWKISNMD
jgi:hypothetical protein